MKPRIHPFLLGMSAAILLALGATGCAHHTAQAPPQAPAPPPMATAAPAEPAPQAQEAPAPPPAVASTPELDPAYFGFDSYALDPSAREALDRVAKRMRDRADLKIRIEGHCDERGTSDYNMALGERRASAARDYLRSAGIAGDRIRIVSYGKERPLVEGHDEAAWAKNRCAQVVPPQTAPGGALTTADSK